MFYKFQFNKLWYPQEEILKIIPIPRATFYRMQDELTEQGRELAEMGKVKIKGVKEVLWDPVKLVQLLNNEKVNQPIKYDYESKKREETRVAVGVFNEQQRKVN